MGIGARLKELRKKLRITQSELAKRIGVHETTIRRWEQEVDRGPDAKSVALLAEILHTTPEYLLKGLKNESEKEEFVSTSENVPNMAYWGSVLDNAEKTAKNGRNLHTIYTLLSDALGVIKTAMSQPV